MTVDELWDLITHLPRTSPLTAARADDPDLPPGEPRPPSWTEFSPERETLANIDDKIGSLLNNVIALGGGKPLRLKPHPRPGDDKRELAARERFAEKWRKHKELAARILRPRKTG